MIISLVAAASDNNVIGKNNSLPWRLPADMKFFKNITMGHTVLMGRKTYQSIGKPLPGRKNIVVTRDKSFSADGCIILHSLPQAFELCRNEDEIFVVGGAEIYRQAMPFAHKIYLTRVHAFFKGDVYLPDMQLSEWHKVQQDEHEADEKNPYPYSFIQFSKIN